MWIRFFSPSHFSISLSLSTLLFLWHVGYSGAAQKTTGHSELEDEAWSDFRHSTKINGCLKRHDDLIQTRLAQPQRRKRFRVRLLDCMDENWERRRRRRRNGGRAQAWTESVRAGSRRKAGVLESLDFSNSTSAFLQQYFHQHSTTASDFMIRLQQQS